MPTVLDVLPHRGGGAETYVDLLETMPGYTHVRRALAPGRSPSRAVVSVAVGLPSLRREARGADIVHLHGDTVAILASGLHRLAPIVITTHGLHRLRRAGGLQSRLVLAGLRHAVAVAACTVCTSDDERRELEALLPADLHTKLVVVHNGVLLPEPPSPGARAAGRKELELDDEAFVVLFVGELEERKQPLVAAQASVRARESGSPITLLVAGEGPLSHALAALAGPAVRVLGYRNDVDKLLALADSFVLSSTREGLSFALLEAMAAGAAVVVADGPGNVEAVGDAGVVVPVGDVGALADAITMLAADSERRRQLGDAARSRVATSFTAEQFVAGVQAVYEAVLHGA